MVSAVLARYPDSQKKGSIPTKLLGVWIRTEGERHEFLVITSSMLLSWTGTSPDGDVSVVPGSSIRGSGSAVQYTVRYVYSRDTFGSREYSTPLTTKLTATGDSLRLVEVKKTINESPGITLTVGNRDVTFSRTDIAPVVKGSEPESDGSTSPSP